MAGMKHFSGNLADQLEKCDDIRFHRIDGYSTLAYSAVLDGVRWFQLVQEMNLYRVHDSNSFAIHIVKFRLLAGASEGASLAQSELQEVGSGHARYSFGIMEKGASLVYDHVYERILDLDAETAAMMVRLFYRTKDPGVSVDGTLRLTGITNEWGEYAFLKKGCYDRKTHYYSADFIIEEEFDLVRDTLRINEDAGIRYEDVPLIPNYRIVRGSSVLVKRIRKFIFTNCGIVFQQMDGGWKMILYSSSDVYDYDVKGCLQRFAGSPYVRVGNCLFGFPIVSELAFMRDGIEVKVIKLTHSTILCLNWNGRSAFSADSYTARCIANGQAVQEFQRLLGFQDSAGADRDNYHKEKPTDVCKPKRIFWSEEVDRLNRMLQVMEDGGRL